MKTLITPSFHPRRPGWCAFWACFELAERRSGHLVNCFFECLKSTGEKQVRALWRARGRYKKPSMKSKMAVRACWRGGKIPAIDQLPLEGAPRSSPWRHCHSSCGCGSWRQAVSAWARACRKSAAAYWIPRSEWQRTWAGGCRQSNRHGQGLQHQGAVGRRCPMAQPMILRL